MNGQEKTVTFTLTAAKRQYEDKATKEVRQFWAYSVKLANGIEIALAPRERSAGQFLALECENKCK